MLEKTGHYRTRWEKYPGWFSRKDDYFERAYERASAKGVDNVWYKRLHKFRDFLLSEEARHDFSEMDEVHKKKCEFELKKIKAAIELVFKSKKSNICIRSWLYRTENIVRGGLLPRIDEICFFLRGATIRVSDRQTD